MQQLLIPELLNIWEQCISRSPVDRYLLLLQAAQPDRAWEELSQESLGQRNAHLLTLREWTFGPELISLATCPACQERLEFSFAASDLQQASDPATGQHFSLAVDGYNLQYRLPTSHDLLTITNSQDARRELLQRCIIRSTHNRKTVEVGQLPAKVIEAVEQAMARLDPLADVQIGMSCPNCGHDWEAGFDIGAFFWQEINAWALHILQEVHLLASAYSWREADILAMSAWKRRLYLKMIYG
jgi:uncharacterized protein (UPF0212 family)